MKLTQEMERDKISQNKDYETVWNNCLQVIRDNVEAESFNNFFVPIKPKKLDHKVLTIEVPSYFYYEWLETHYIDILRKVLRHELGETARLEYEVAIDRDLKRGRLKVPSTNNREIVNPPSYMPININKGRDNANLNPFVVPGLKKIEINSQLNPEKSFENFVEGDCNRLAFSAGLAVAGNPGKGTFNPLFIYSKVGLGKTHLLNAIGLKVKELSNDKIVLYVSAEQLIQQYVDAVKNRSINDFQHFYEMVDVLLVDDIQVLSSKQKTQDVFFQLFNHLHQSGKQLVISSDRPPVDLVGFEDRLLSRFKWGLSADLQVPDYQTKVAILKKRIYNDGMDFPEEVIRYMANNINSNIRELEGALTSIMAQSSLNHKEITLELAKQMIDKYVKVTSREITIDYIQKVVCDYFNLPLEKINSQSRERALVQARQLIMYYSKKYTKNSLAVIGIHCGKKDHATVLHACKAVNNLIETDKQFRQHAEKIEKKLKL